MKNVFLFLFLLFLAVGTLPNTASAVQDTLNLSNCDAIGFVPSLCGSLKEYSKRAGWSSEEEKRFLMKIFGEGEIMPRHDFVKEWNTGLDYGREPVLGHSQSKGCPFLIEENSPQDCINYAWLNSLSVEPSLIENSTYYIHTQGESFAAYYYELSDPRNLGRSVGSTKKIWSGSDKSISDYENDYGHCRTEFWYEDESTITMKMGNTVLSVENATENGGYSLGPYIADTLNPEFKATLEINNRVFMKHYDWEKVDSGCKDDCEENCCWKKYKCQREGRISSNVVSITITHKLNRKPQVYQKKPITHDIVVENVESTPAGVIETNADEYKLFLGEAMLQKTGVRYPITYIYHPYNILTVTKESGDGYFVKDVHVEETTNSTASFTTYPYNMEECNFVVLWPFDHDVHECNVLQKATTELDIEIDETHYEIGEEKINVKIDFDSDDEDDSAAVKLVYGSEEQTVNVNGRKTIKLEPQEGYNSIYAEFAGDDSRSPAEAFAEGVYGSEDNFSVYWKVVVLAFVAYGLVFLTRKYAY